MSNVTASAPRTRRASPVAWRVPPVGSTRTRASKRSAPVMGRPSAVAAGAVSVDAAHHEVAVRGRLDRRTLRRLHPRGERDLSGTAGGQPHDDDLRRRAREHLARERHAAAGVGHVRRCRRQIQIASVVLDGIDVGERQRQIADRLIRHLREGLRHDFRFGELSPPRRTCALRADAALREALSFASGLTGSYGRPAHRVSSFSCSRSCDDAAEDHRAETAVADRKCAHPLRGGRLAALPRRADWQQRVIGRWCSIPQAECRRWRRSFAGQPR